MLTEPPMPVPERAACPGCFDRAPVRNDRPCAGC